MGYLKLPEGKRIAVNLGVDVDAQSLWLGGFNRPSPSFMSRGEFGAQVGVPRLLKLFKENNIKTTFFIPGHTVDTFPEISKAIFDAGHEIAHHGYYHENPTLVNRDTERRLMDLAFACYKRHFGIRPVGYRSPYWDYSENTLDLLEEAGFLYDSSLMARDLVPYHPQRWQVNWETGNIAGPASAILEIPVSWYLDDFPALAYTGNQEGMSDTDGVLRRWKDIFTYAYNHQENGLYAMALHPQIIGHGHHMMML
ncbi:polysaccharide deacetylase, partial [Salmonella enterica subsp. enterica serovar Kentucky]|nr:polysaccharide deacetylase [Salmonella enterica subsp. enterica serovar Kentucky]